MCIRDSVYLKATEGLSFRDPAFVTNRAGALSKNIEQGAYHYVSPDDDGNAQAGFLMSTLGGHIGELPIAADAERTPEGRAADEWMVLSLEDKVLKLCHFADAVHAACTIKPVLYASPAFVREQLGSDPRLAEAFQGIWLAEYNVAEPDVPAPFTPVSYTHLSLVPTGVVIGSSEANSQTFRRLSNHYKV